MTFVLGRVKELPQRDRAVIIGNCARGVANCGHFVPGCPPNHVEIDAAARKVSEIGGAPKKLG